MLAFLSVPFVVKASITAPMSVTVSASVGGGSVSVSELVATRGTAMSKGSHAVVTGAERRSFETPSMMTRTAVFSASVRTIVPGHVLFSAPLPPAHGVVAGSAEGATRRAVHGPRRTSPSRRHTAAVDMGRAMEAMVRAVRPSHAPLTGSTSTKTLARARNTLSSASHRADGLAFDEPELYQAVGAYAKRAQQGLSLPGLEENAASNQGGVNGTLFLAVAVAVDPRAFDNARVDVVDVVNTVAVVVVRAARGLLLLFLVDVLRVAVGDDFVAAAAHQRTSFSLAQLLLLAFIRAVTSQDQTRRGVFQKPPRC